MTSRNPTKKERAAHAARVRADRQAKRDALKCRDCDEHTLINPRNGFRFVSCPVHRAADRARKKKSNGKR